VRHILKSSCVVILWALVTLPAHAAHTRASLALSLENAPPGGTVLAGIHLRMDPKWHTYWQNPGASGIPTTIAWTLPPGITAGTPEWPIPEKLPDPDLTTYIYKDEVLIIVPLKLTANLAAGRTQIKAAVSWLECDVQCIPGHADVEAVLTVGPESKPSPDSALFDAWLRKLPKEDKGISAAAAWEKAASADLRPLLFEWNSGGETNNADFYPDASNDFEVHPAVDLVAASPNKTVIRKELKKISGDWPKVISGLLLSGEGANRTAYQVKLDIGLSRKSMVAPTSISGSPNQSPTPALLTMLIYGFLGGLILNVMPCVLPVIALKILGFVGQARDNPGRARFLGLVYAAGVLASFLALAAIVLAVKAAGHKAGWGIQFSSPYFLIAMTTLVTLIAINLFGVFEVTLGSRTMDAAANLSSGHGTAGAFFNGLLATVLATSCTAPYLGAAVGFAFAPNQTATATLLVFLSAGTGLALPYVVLTWQPAWLRFLPKPGLWMERFKIAMGFPMLAAAVWLFSLSTVYYGDRAWWLAIFLVMIAVAAWVYGEFIQKNRTHPVAAAVVIIAVLAGGYFFVLEDHLRYRAPITGDQPATAGDSEPGGVAWSPWSTVAVARAREEHHPVLVDFTAKWCLTCNTVVKPALESATVRKKLQELNAVTLLADYTRFPDDITEELNRHSRAGVPLVLVYPPDPAKPAIVLPEALTPGIVVSALERASSDKP
jgi:thiol:disulfide interchange protein